MNDGPTLDRPLVWTDQSISYLVIAETKEDVADWCRMVGLEPGQGCVRHARAASDFLRADPASTVIALGPNFFRSRWFKSAPHVWLQRRINAATPRPTHGLSRLLDVVAGWMLFIAITSGFLVTVTTGLGFALNERWLGMAVWAGQVCGWAVTVGAFSQAWTDRRIDREARRTPVEDAISG